MSEEYDRTGKKIVTFNKPIRWATLNMNESVSKSRIPVDDDGNVVVQPVIVVDPIHDPDFLSTNDVSTRTTTYRNAATIAAGNTTIWTPVAGRRIVLAGYHLTVSGGVTFGVAGGLLIDINGSVFGLLSRVNIACPLAAVTGIFYDTHYLFNPQLEVFAADELLRINLTLPGAATGDVVRVQAWGYEV